MTQVITAPKQVTRGWLTDALRRSGALPWGEVRSAALTRVHDVQVHSLSYFFVLEYSADAPPDAPRRLFLKIPRDNAALPALKGGARDVRLYQVLRTDHEALLLVRCYDAAVDPEMQRYHFCWTILLAWASTYASASGWPVATGTPPAPIRRA